MSATAPAQTVLMDQRSQEIIAQVAVKSAVELIGPVSFADLPEDAFASTLEETSQIIYDRIIALATPTPQAQIEAQFPGAEVVPISSAQGYGQAGPAPVPGVASGSNSSDEAKWQRYFADPGAYYDNRGNKTSPKSPDFKQKQGDKEALWINSKGTPGWVYARFGQANPANANF